MSVPPTPKILELEKRIEAAKLRYDDARQRGDQSAMSAAANEWQAAEEESKRYVLGQVEPYSDN